MRRLFQAKPALKLLLLPALALICVLSLRTSAQQVNVVKDGAPPAANKKEGAAATKAPALLTQRFEKEGVQVNFSIKSLPDEKGRNNGLVSGADALISFSLKDARTGQPITGLHPSAWLSSRKTVQPPSEIECKEKIRTLTGGLLSIRAEVDLNSYVLLTLNHDQTITFINPQISFNKTKLESIVVLPGAGADWTLSKDKDFLYVTLPDRSAVAVINTATRKLVGTIQTGAKGRPMRIALQPDGRYVWVGLDDAPQVAVIDTKSQKLVATVPVGEGLHNLAFTPDSSLALITNSTGDSVSVIETRQLTKSADISVGKTPVPIAYSSASRMFYVAALNGASISVIDPARLRLVKTIPTKRGIVALRFEPKGRFALAVNQPASEVSVLDAATNTLTAAVGVVKEPDQVTFTQRFAYIRGTDSEKISLIELGGVEKGRLSPVDIVVGRTPPSALPQEIGVSDMIAPTPEGNAAMIANAPDQMIYYYVEGMMAPMGTFSNYKRRPHALMLIDRSLSEIEPGVYASTLKLTGAGRYDVPFILDQPRIGNCFQMEIAESPDGEEARPASAVTVEALFKDKSFKPQNAAPLRFRIIDAATKQPLAGISDVQVLVFEPPGIWQQRQFAKEVEKGIYEVTQSFPHDGLYYVMLRISSRGINFSDLPYTPVKALADAKPE
ncbi:MAG TPA: hypothetical protein VGB17_20015 [Pyrinomonadaceae bacterium]|jgi:YVTN family beta-propeller protein